MLASEWTLISPLRENSACRRAISLRAVGAQLHLVAAQFTVNLPRQCDRFTLICIARRQREF
jgi:hypothetical protein